MYGCSFGGAFFGLLWPILVALWKRQQAQIYKWIGPEDKTRFGGAEGVAPPSLLRRILVEYVLPIFLFFVLAILISFGTSALGFFVFLQDEKARQKLQELGVLAYFSAFSSGFASAAFVSEPLKRG
jgi:hypothetical protein